MTKPLLDLVVHVFSEKIPEFASLLTAQLSSLILWPPKQCSVNVVVFYTESDLLTVSVLKSFEYKMPRDVRIAPWQLDKPRLFRRAIGRNLAAKYSSAETVFHTDADYIFASGCLDTLAAECKKGFPSQLVFPRTVHIHKRHDLGDAEIARVVPGKLFIPDFNLFEPRTETKAIGGLQITSGDTAREFGYCDKTRWIEPVSEEGGFRNTTEDKVFRNLMGGSQPIDIPNLYRQRHSGSAWQTREQRLAQTEGKA